MLVSWYSAPADNPSQAECAALHKVFDKVSLFPIKRTLSAMARRLITLPRFSPHISTRIISADEYADLLSEARSFAPNAIWLDSLYGGVVAAHFARDLHLPIFYRSHNIEHQYMRSQADQALTLRDRIAWSLACTNLKSFETSIQRSSKFVFDISCDDLQFWRAMGIYHNSWAPALFVNPGGQNQPIPYAVRSFDLVFLGSLFSPNSVRGLEWLVDGVLPILRRSRPSIKMRIAGSRPNDRIRSLVARNPEISLLEAPTDAGSVWREGRILVNPILTGSGMNVKSAEMLFHDAHLMTTTVGTRGFPADIQTEFHVADTTDSFAEALLRLVDTPYELTASRRAARQRLGPSGIDAIIKIMTERVSAAV